MSIRKRVERGGTARRAAPPQHQKPRNNLVIGGVIGGAGFVIAIIAAVLAMSGAKPEPEKPPAPVVSRPDPLPVEKEPALRPGTRLPEPKNTEPPPPPPDPAAEFKKRIAWKRAEAAKRLEQAKDEIAAERKGLEEAEGAFTRRLAGRPVDLLLRSGEKYPKATIKRSTFVEVDFDAGKPVSVPWDSIAPESVLAAADALYDATRAETLVERGRFLLARRMWKEAKESFTRAAKLDESMQSRLEEVGPILDRILDGKAAYRGSARRIGPTGLSLTYDFKDEGQLGDFGKGLKIENGALILEHKDRYAWGHGPNFIDEVEVEARVTADGAFTIHFVGGNEWMELTLDPAGAELHDIDLKSGMKMTRKAQIAKAASARLVKGRASDVRFSLKGRKLRVTIDKAEALTAELPPSQEAWKGYVSLGVAGGRVTISALAIRGQMDARELDKRFAEVEILVRRAVDPDLKDIEESRGRDRAREALGSVEGITLSADDAYFTIERMGNDLVHYDDMKRQLAEYLATGIGRKAAEKSLNEMMERCKDVPSLFYLRGRLRFILGDFEGCRSDNKKALELFPEFVEALVLESRMLDLLDGDYEGGLKFADRAVAALPDFAPAYVQRAEARFAIDRAHAVACMEDLRIALTLSPSNRNAPSLLRAYRYEARGPKDLGCRFDHESAHYIVTTDISAEAAKAYSDRLEAGFAHFKEVWKAYYTEKPFPKPRVAVFNTAENYYTYGELISEDRGEQSVGVFRKRFNELVLFDNLDEAETLDTLHHEAFHHFFALMVKHETVRWYEEGMAEYMAGITIKEGKVVESGRLQRGRLVMLQLLMGAGLSFTWDDFMQEPPNEFYGGMASFKYGQAWSMIHFLTHYENGKYRGLIDRYFELLRDKKGAKVAFETVFGDKHKELTKEWKKYVGKMK